MFVTAVWFLFIPKLISIVVSTNESGVDIMFSRQGLTEAERERERQRARINR